MQSSEQNDDLEDLLECNEKVGEQVGLCEKPIDNYQSPVKNTKILVFDSFGKVDGTNDNAAAEITQNNNLAIENTEVGQKRMDEPGEPSISDMLQNKISRFEDKIQSDVLINDLDESLENETYQQKSETVHKPPSSSPGTDAQAHQPASTVQQSPLPQLACASSSQRSANLPYTTVSLRHNQNSSGSKSLNSSNQSELAMAKQKSTKTANLQIQTNSIQRRIE